VGILTVVVILLAACGGGASPTPSPLGLEGRTWKATLIGDAPPLADAAPTIRFENGQAGGTTGCNLYGGAYHVGGDGTFKVDSMLMTEMACDGPRGEQESVVIEILTKADRIELVNGELKISGPAGSITFAEVMTLEG
jgi:heat shock protein HslJ